MSENVNKFWTFSDVYKDATSAPGIENNIGWTLTFAMIRYGR